MKQGRRSWEIRDGSGRGGEFDGEARAGRGGAFNDDPAAMGGGKSVDDGEAEPDARGFPAEFGAAPEEGLEHAIAVFMRDARTAIGDPEPGVARVRVHGGVCGGWIHADGDDGVGRAVLEGVVDEIDEDLAHRGGIGGDDDGMVGELCVEPDGAVGGGGGEGFDGGADEFGEIDGFECQGMGVAFEMGVAEDVLDEEAKAPGLAQDEAGIV